jgi:hypothetical protein
MMQAPRPLMDLIAEDYQFFWYKSSYGAQDWVLAEVKKIKNGKNRIRIMGDNWRDIYPVANRPAIPIIKPTIPV